MFASPSASPPPHDAGLQGAGLGRAARTDHAREEIDACRVVTMDLVARRRSPVAFVPSAAADKGYHAPGEKGGGPYGSRQWEIIDTRENLVRAAGLEPAQALLPYGFSYQLRLSPPRIGAFVVWTIPSPWLRRFRRSFRRYPSSLYTFPSPGLARDCHLTGSPEFGQFYFSVSRRALNLRLSPLRLPISPRPRDVPAYRGALQCGQGEFDPGEFDPGLTAIRGRENAARRAHVTAIPLKAGMLPVRRAGLIWGMLPALRLA